MIPVLWNTSEGRRHFVKSSANFCFAFVRVLVLAEMHTQLHILGVLIFMMYYVGMEIGQPISTEAQIGVGYHTLLGSHRTHTTQPSPVSLHKNHWQWVRGRKTVFKRWLMAYEGFTLQHNMILLKKMSGQWWHTIFYQAYKHITFWTSSFHSRDAS